MSMPSNMNAIKDEGDRDIALTAFAAMAAVGQTRNDPVQHYEVRGKTLKGDAWILTGYGIGKIDARFFAQLHKHADICNPLDITTDAHMQPLFLANCPYRGALVIHIHRTEYEEEQRREEERQLRLRREREEAERKKIELEKARENSLLLPHSFQKAVASRHDDSPTSGRRSSRENSTSRRTAVRRSGSAVNLSSSFSGSSSASTGDQQPKNNSSSSSNNKKKNGVNTRSASTGAINKRYQKTAASRRDESLPHRRSSRENAVYSRRGSDGVGSAATKGRRTSNRERALYDTVHASQLDSDTNDDSDSNTSFMQEYSDSDDSDHDSSEYESPLPEKNIQSGVLSTLLGFFENVLDRVLFIDKEEYMDTDSTLPISRKKKNAH